MVLDELLVSLDALPTGLRVGNSTISTLAYADDLLLLTPSPGDMRIMVSACVRFFEARSMELKAGKCANLTVKLLPSRSKLYLSSQTSITIRGSQIPSIDAESHFKYLGHHYGFMGSNAPSYETLQFATNNLKRAPLKPPQKLELLQGYLIPKFLFGLQNPKINITILSKADKIIRRCVKETLHLPMQTANALLYAKCRDGGMGLMCFSARIPDILLGRMRQLREKGDPQVLVAFGTDYFLSVANRLQSAIGPFGSGTQQSTFWRHRLSSSASGAGLHEHCGHPSANGWIRDPPPHWSGGDYVLAVQLRTNTLPTRGGLHNVRLPLDSRTCRGGCQRVETHHPRIARHDHAVRTFARACIRKGHITEVEPHIRGTDGRFYKPDLVVRTPTHVHVIDVGVNWETPRPLTDQYQNKVAVYSTPGFLSALRRLHPGPPINVGAIILGARGTWCSLNDQVIHSLGLGRSVSLSLISGVLHGGVIIHRAFSAAVWDNPHR